MIFVQVYRGLNMCT